MLLKIMRTKMRWFNGEVIFQHSSEKITHVTLDACTEAQHEFWDFACKVHNQFIA